MKDHVAELKPLDINLDRHREANKEVALLQAVSRPSCGPSGSCYISRGGGVALRTSQRGDVKVRQAAIDGPTAPLPRRVSRAV